LTTLKGENARGGDDAMAQRSNEEFNRITERQMAKLEEERARWEAEREQPE
jgi:hypothetical protein